MCQKLGTCSTARLAFADRPWSLPVPAPKKCRSRRHSRPPVGTAQQRCGGAQRNVLDDLVRPGGEEEEGKGMGPMAICFGLTQQPRLGSINLLEKTSSEKPPVFAQNGNFESHRLSDLDTPPSGADFTFQPINFQPAPGWPKPWGEQFCIIIEVHPLLGRNISRQPTRLTPVGIGCRAGRRFLCLISRKWFRNREAAMWLHQQKGPGGY